MLVLCFNLLSFGGRELSSKYWWGVQLRPGLLGMCHAGCTGPTGQRDVVCYSANFLSWQCHLLYENKLGVVTGLLKVKLLLKMFQMCCFPFCFMKMVMRQLNAHACIYTWLCIYECTQHLCLCVLWVGMYKSIRVCLQIKPHVYNLVTVKHVAVVVFSCFHEVFWLALVINFNIPR